MATLCMTAIAPLAATAQVPDLLTAFDAGGRAMGAGGSTRVTDANTQSALDNPAGLGFVNETTFGVNFRNFPKSATIVTGNFNDRDFTNQHQVGRMGLSHVGYAMPFRGGTLGISYTVTGHLDNITVGNNLTLNTLNVQNLQEINRAQTDMFTVSYGTQRGSVNYGFGVVIANQYVRATQSYQLFDGSTQVGTVDSDESGNGTGIGLVAGVQGVASSNMVWGASIRTPIDLQGNGSTASIYDKLPGKASFGVAGRFAGFASGSDFMTWGLQGDYYFGGSGSAVFARDDTLAYGVGVEYNLFRFGGRIPVRIGYAGIPSGGEGFSSRDSLTFGLGYRPNNQDFTFDLNFARPTNGGPFDMSIGITYRPN